MPTGTQGSGSPTKTRSGPRILKVPFLKHVIYNRLIDTVQVLSKIVVLLNRYEEKLPGFFLGLINVKKKSVIESFDSLKAFPNSLESSMV
jgi:hypothetical protein